MAVTKKILGTIDGKDIYKFTLKNKNNIEISCLNYGGIITEILTPDRYGNYENIVLSFDDFCDYKVNEAYFGAIIGRVAGRIKDAKFSIDDKEYFLEKNDGENCLHGGINNFSHSIWDVGYEDESTLKFTYFSKDGSCGFPGNIKMEVKYTLTDEDEFVIHYRGEADGKTILNPTSHSYFNLSGNAKNTIYDHLLKISSDNFLEIDEKCIPTGKLIDVKDTPFDFNELKNISDGLNPSYIQNEIVGGGYDHTFILNKHFDNEIMLYDRLSGRGLIVETSAPSVVVYTSNKMKEDFKVNGTLSKKYMGICLETQIEPDAINSNNFSNCVIDKNEVFLSTTKYSFKVMNF